MSETPRKYQQLIRNGGDALLGTVITVEKLSRSSEQPIKPVRSKSPSKLHCITQITETTDNISVSRSPSLDESCHTLSNLDKETPLMRMRQKRCTKNSMQRPKSSHCCNCFQFSGIHLGKDIYILADGHSEAAVTTNCEGETSWVILASPQSVEVLLNQQEQHHGPKSSRASKDPSVTGQVKRNPPTGLSTSALQSEHKRFQERGPRHIKRSGNRKRSGTSSLGEPIDIIFSCTA